MGSPRDAAKAIEFDAVIAQDGTVTYEHDAADEAEVRALIGRLDGEHAPRSFDPNILATSIARVLAPQLKRLLRPVGVPPDDAFVDQDAGLFDREVYLRLARRGAFPNTKVGQKRVARWADVKAAFMGVGKQIAVVEPTDDPKLDRLNEIRQRLGLQVKGRR
jgi:hypothetical protein